MSKIKVRKQVKEYKSTKRAGRFEALLECGHKEVYILYTRIHPTKLVCRRCSIEEYKRQRDAKDGHQEN